jgi:tetratricopeptide (TPR) repeat protein
VAFALGYAALVEGDQASGLRWLTRTQSSLGPDDHLMRARVAFEIGAIYIARGTAVPAQVLLETNTSGSDLSDMLHLQALSAEAMGDHTHAIELYRRVLSAEVRALTPATRVLAMVNLASSISNRDPEESLALSELAIAMIDACELHERLRPPALNVMGYALICLGRLDDARSRLRQAAEEAARHHYDRVALYAQFNQAILDELQGDVAGAAHRLDDVVRSSATPFPELAEWARVRQAWLTWLNGDVAAATSQLAELRQRLRSMRYADALACLAALVDCSGNRTSRAILAFEHLRKSARLRGDAVTELALLLRLADLERRLGSQQRAMRHARAVLELLRANRVVLSPNWWSAEIVASFAASVDDPLARALHAPALAGPAPFEPPVVWIQSDGTARLGGRDLHLNWTVGRTGSGVLRRLFSALLVAHPSPLPRDTLADHLWPESEGDSSIRNVYGAVNDLRKVLTDLPGIRLSHDRAGYRLQVANNVRLMASVHTRPERTHY